jgi:hypothetical protein
MILVFFLEELSAKKMLEVIVPKILNNITTIYITFQGKQDLEKNIELKLKNWNVPNAKFLIMRDKDSGNCKEIKQNLLEKIQNSGKENSSLVRIACHELESFYLGDLSAVGDAFNLNNISKNQDKKKYRNPDNLTNAKEELKKVINNYAEISGSKKISPFLKLDNSNKSVSFNFLISGIQKLCNT